jgi:hypothetical protein
MERGREYYQKMLLAPGLLEPYFLNIKKFKFKSFKKISGFSQLYTA